MKGSVLHAGGSYAAFVPHYTECHSLGKARLAQLNMFKDVDHRTEDAVEKHAGQTCTKVVLMSCCEGLAALTRMYF